MRRLDLPTFPSAGLLSLRIVVGITFLVHGLDKLFDLSGAERVFASYSIPAPGVMAPFVGVVETEGGLLLIAGLATRLAGAVVAGDMVVALGTAHDDLKFFAAQGGIELEALLVGACLALVLAGAGRLSLDDLFGRLPADSTETATVTRQPRGHDHAPTNAKVTT